MPSPSHEMASGDLSLFCINVGGAPGAWRLHEETIIGADLLALQEINMTPAEWNAFTPFCKEFGCSPYYQIGPCSAQGDSERYRGGVAWLVHHRVNHAFCDQFSSNATQGIAIWVHGTCLLNLYVPPGHDAVATAALTMFWEQHRIHSKQLVISIILQLTVRLANGCNLVEVSFSPISPLMAVDGKVIASLTGLWLLILIKWFLPASILICTFLITKVFGLRYQMSG